MRPYQNYYNEYPFNAYRGNTPFSVPRMPTKDINPIKKPLTISKALTNAEKGIDTISSLIPIYQKVKPVIENSKDFVNLIKKKITTSSKKNVEKVDVEVVDNEEKNETKEEKEVKEETKPNKPFF